MTRGELARSAIGGWAFATLWVVLNAMETGNTWTWVAAGAVALTLLAVIARTRKDAWGKKR